jgi:hypothetical protein
MKTHSVVRSLTFVLVIFGLLLNFSESIRFVEVQRVGEVYRSASTNDSRVCHPRIPQNDCDAAIYVYEFVLTHNWTPPKGYKGNKPYQNKAQLLPAAGQYLEYDIYPTPPPNVGGRDDKRVIIDKVSQEMYYSSDHYDSFVHLTYS